MNAMVLDLVLAAVLVVFALYGYHQGFVVSVLSLLGFISGGALGMWLLPELLRRWDSVDGNVVRRTVVLVFGVLFLAALGQAVAVGAGYRLRRELRDKPARVVDSVMGALASVLVVSVLVWFMAGAVRGGASATSAKAIGGSRIVQTIDRFVPPQTARLFAGFRSVLAREGFPRVFEGIQAEPIAPIAAPDNQQALGAGVARAATSIVKITGVAAAGRQRLGGCT